MIPNLKKSGLLPAGVNYAGWKEFIEKFGFNDGIQKLLERLLKSLKFLYKNKCEYVYIGGSFVTNKSTPEDVDVCFDNTFMKLNEFQKKYPAFQFNEEGYYSLYKQYKANFYPFNSYDDYFIHFFQFSKLGEAKGIVKLDLKEVCNNDKK
jgi:hypothetical protein